MGDACLPWNVYTGRHLLPDVCRGGVSRIASAVMCLECMLLAEIAHQTFVSKLLGLSHNDKYRKPPLSHSIWYSYA